MSKVTFDWFKTFEPVGNPNPSMAVFKSPGFTKSRCEANPIPASSSGVNVGDSISTTSPVSPFLSELVISTLTCNPSVTVTGVPNFIVELVIFGASVGSGSGSGSGSVPGSMGLGSSITYTYLGTFPKWSIISHEASSVTDGVTPPVSLPGSGRLIS